MRPSNEITDPTEDEKYKQAKILHCLGCITHDPYSQGQWGSRLQSLRIVRALLGELVSLLYYCKSCRSCPENSIKLRKQTRRTFIGHRPACRIPIRPRTPRQRPAIFPFRNRPGPRPRLLRCGTRVLFARLMLSGTGYLSSWSSSRPMMG